MRSSLIFDILLICLGNWISCFMIIDFNSTMFLALNGGLHKDMFTFHRASNNSTLQVNKYLLCLYILGFEELMGPYSKEILTLSQLDLLLQESLKTQSQLFWLNYHVGECWQVWGPCAKFYVYRDVRIHELFHIGIISLHLPLDISSSWHRHLDRPRCKITIQDKNYWGFSSYRKAE